jgi:rhodanese-related sulfurtransferase
LFSGGSLLVDAVARTDLIAPDQTEALARALWRSLQRVLTLPDDVAVYPTHGAGSFCAVPTRGERTTTIGRERAANPLLSAADEDAFVDQLLGGYGTFPPYFLRLRERNRRGPDVLGAPFPPLDTIDVEETRRHLEAGAQVVDARPVRDWAAGHIAGAVSIPLRPQFASWLGWLVEDESPLLFVLNDEQDAGDLVRQARTIGYEHLGGRLAGGMGAWTAAGQRVATTELIDAARLDRPVVDVRQASEYAAGHVREAINIELGDVAGRADAIPAGPVAMMCGHGERAAGAASLLERQGRTDIAVVIGGPDEWATAEHHLASGP